MCQSSLKNITLTEVYSRLITIMIYHKNLAKSKYHFKKIAYVLTESP